MLYLYCRTRLRNIVGAPARTAGCGAEGPAQARKEEGGVAVDPKTPPRPAAPLPLQQSLAAHLLPLLRLEEFGKDEHEEVVVAEGMIERSFWGKYKVRRDRRPKYRGGFIRHRSRTGGKRRRLSTTAAAAVAGRAAAVAAGGRAGSCRD